MYCLMWKSLTFSYFCDQFPGALFGLGHHTVKYVATTTDGLKLTCSFKIHVKRKCEMFFTF